MEHHDTESSSREGTMETLWQFLAVAGTAASVAGVILAWQTRDTKQLLDRVDARHLAHHAQTQALLDRMDRAADQRAETLKVLLAGGRDDRRTP
jgi:hypothetical protein